MNKVPVPGFFTRIFAVWWRHIRVYSGSLFSNATPPFLEPLIFLAGVGLGLGQYVGDMNGSKYVEFLAVGLIVTSSMYTAAFENTFGTFIRLEFDKVYDGMIASSLTARDLLVGEILFTATKGAFFSLASLIVLNFFGLVPSWWTWLAVFIGFLTAAMFSVLSLLVTSFVRNINHFNFYFTLFISPLFFFSGVVFPLEQLPPTLLPVAFTLPLTHSVAIVRALGAQTLVWDDLWHLGYIVLFILVIGALAIRQLGKRLVS